jgi:hypothetical protein
MADNTTAVVETITAEVRTLMVGSRQVTASVYNQLDFAETYMIIPFGRVTPKDATPGYVYIAGKHKHTGELVRSRTPCDEYTIEREIASVSKANHYEREAAACRTAARKEIEQADAADKNAASRLEREAGYTCAAYYDRKLPEAEALAADAEDELDRLKYLAEAAEARYRAAKYRAEAAEYRDEAAAHRDAAKRHEEDAINRDRAAETQANNASYEAETLTELADQWSELPLIVLAGLR